MQDTTIHTEETLRKHLELCQACYALLQKENSFLKNENKPTSRELLEDKKALLASLENSNKQLQLINEQKLPLTQTQKKLAQDAQKKIMKIFLMDRENEQLLLKYSMHQTVIQSPSPPPIATPNQVKQAYE